MSSISKNVVVGILVPMFVFGFVVLSNGEISTGDISNVHYGIAKTYGDGDSGGGDGGGDGGGYTPPTYCTDGATNYPYCNNKVCTNGATNYPYCNNQCVPLGTQTQTLSCPSGQTGSITQTRTHSCPANTWSAWTTTGNTCVTPTCTNGTTNYPECNICPSGKVYQNGQCVNPTCSNGATNFPYCNACPTGQYYINGVCTNTPPTCTNGATNYPYCNNNVCTNGATNYPACNNVCTNGYSNYPTCGPTTCTNGATNFPLCNNQCTPLGTQIQTLSCPYGQSGSITQTRTHSCPANTWSDWFTTTNNCQNNTCTNGATNYPYCNNNTCTNGATNYPLCNNNTCTNGTTNYPYCNQCPSGLTFINGSCTYHNPTCTNGATNYPWCNNNTCTNGATNYPLCNNNVCNNGCNNYPNCNTCPIGMVMLNGQCTYHVPTPPPVQPPVWCNGVQYYAGYICPQNNLAVQTTGANPLSTTATIYGYVNPYNTNATIWFDYGTSYSGLQYQTTRQNTSSTGQFTASLSNLTCGTRYYYRAVAQNNVETKYGSTLSFVTPNCYKAPVYYDNLTVTRIATKVGSKSGQLNGSFINNSGNISSCVAFFDYGTSISNLNKRTGAQKLYANYKTNYFSQGVYGLLPSTTYYYRAGTTCVDGTKFGQIYKFTTGKVVKNYVAPAPVTIVADNDDCNCEIPEYMNITVDAMEGEATIGKTANYRVNFKNVSETAINNVVVRVILPEELTVAGADKGQFTKGGKTVILTIPMLRAMEEGSIIVSANVMSGLEVGRQIVVNAYADYTTPTLKKSGNLNKGEVTAYTISVAGNGTAMNPSTGSGLNNTSYPDWMPQNLLEWLLFIVVLGIFFSALRYLFSAFK